MDDWENPSTEWSSDLRPAVYFPFDNANCYKWMRDSRRIDPPPTSLVDGKVWHYINTINIHCQFTHTYVTNIECIMIYI